MSLQRSLQKGFQAFSGTQSTGLPQVGQATRVGFFSMLLLQMKKAASAAFACLRLDQTEKEEPQPQVDTALGFLMTNWAPSSPSL